MNPESKVFRRPHLRAGLQGLTVGRDAGGQDHELLHRQIVAGVAAAVDDVEGGHRQRLRAASIPGSVRVWHSSSRVPQQGPRGASRHGDDPGTLPQDQQHDISPAQVVEALCAQATSVQSIALAQQHVEPSMHKLGVAG